MAANVETMFYTREKPWHGLGVRVEEAPASADALKLAGLDWEVLQKDIYTESGDKVAGYKANVRSTDDRVLGVVTDRYKVVQNKEAFAFTDTLLVIVSLSNSMEPLAVEVVAVGGIDSCMLDNRSVFKHALLNNATSILCFHNHPSGKLNPSRADVTMTSKLWEAGAVMDIRLLDHIIVSEKGYYSFKENNMLGEVKECMKKYQRQESAEKRG